MPSFITGSGRNDLTLVFGRLKESFGRIKFYKNTSRLKSFDLMRVNP